MPFTGFLQSVCSPYGFSPPAQLEQAVAAMSYMVNECTDDLDQFCMGVAAGNGRLKDCLEKNGSKASSRCKDAMKQVGLNICQRGRQYHAANPYF
jgi:hypothetical protein